MSRFNLSELAVKERAITLFLLIAIAAAGVLAFGKLGRAEVSEKMPRLADRFAWLDDNRDGFLTRAELQEGRHH